MNLGSQAIVIYLVFCEGEQAAKVTQSEKKSVAQSQSSKLASEPTGADAPSDEGQQLSQQIKVTLNVQGKKHDGKSLTQNLPTVRTTNSVALYFPITVTQTYQLKYGDTEMGVELSLVQILCGVSLD